MIRSCEKWLWGYFRSVLGRQYRPFAPSHLMFCVADHFEPFWNGASHRDALARIGRWTQEYPEAVDDFRDSDGIAPRHTMFYPEEEYRPDCIGRLESLLCSGHAELELHLHHRNDTEQGLRSKIEKFRDILSREHGLLGRNTQGEVKYGFVHGNWALCNSLPDGDWCGVNDELGVLCETGCYADFTFPSAPSPTQPRIVNSIYRASDIDGKPRAHDYGVPVVAGDERPRQASELILIQGPLGLDWRRRKYGLLPRLDNAEVSGVNVPLGSRIDLWVRQAVGIRNRPEWVFVKVHTHGCVDSNADVLLGEPMRQAHEYLRDHYNDGVNWSLHYVSAREMYNIVRAAEDGKDGQPGAYRDYEISLPSCCLPNDCDSRIHTSKQRDIGYAQE